MLRAWQLVETEAYTLVESVGGRATRVPQVREADRECKAVDENQADGSRTSRVNQLRDTNLIEAEWTTETRTAMP